MKSIIVTIPVDEQKKMFRGHHRLHADEILVLAMLAYTREGRTAFPNIFPNGFDFKKLDLIWTNDLPHGYTYNRFPAKLHVGCGKSPFDEHGNPDRKEDAACTLVADYLNFFNRPLEGGKPHWWPTLEAVRFADRYAKNTDGAIPYVVNRMYDYFDEETVIRWALVCYGAELANSKDRWEKLCDDYKNINTALDVWDKISKKMPPLNVKTVRKLLQQSGSDDLDFFQKTLTAFYEKMNVDRKKADEIFRQDGKCYVLRDYLGRTGRNLKLFTCKTDNSFVTDVCWNLGADILVNQMSSGHVAILTRRPLGISLKEVFEEIGLRETNPLAVWYLPEHCLQLLNGSKTHTGVVPTGLTLDTIANIICYVLRKSENRGEVNVGVAFDLFEARFGGLFPDKK